MVVIENGNLSTITVNEIGYYGLIVSNQSGCTSFDYLFVNFVDERKIVKMKAVHIPMHVIMNQMQLLMMGRVNIPKIFIHQLLRE